MTDVSDRAREALDAKPEANISLVGWDVAGPSYLRWAQRLERAVRDILAGQSVGEPVTQADRDAYALIVEGDSDNPLRVAKANNITFGYYDDEVASWKAAPDGQCLAELEAGKAELLILMDSIWRAEFRHEAPNWKPLDDLPGMISQLDNMYAGVRSQRDAARFALAALANPAPSDLESSK